VRLDSLSPSRGSKRPSRRIGRGNGSGRGTTAGKGTKGQKARSGGIKAGFEGRSSREQRYGKAPGFTNIFRTEYAVVKLSDLSVFERDEVVDIGSLRERGLVRGMQQRPVKILSNGEIDKPLTIRVEKVTAAARQKLEQAGGRVEDMSDGSSST